MNDSGESGERRQDAGTISQGSNGGRREHGIDSG